MKKFRKLTVLSIIVYVVYILLCAIAEREIGHFIVEKAGEKEYRVQFSEIEAGIFTGIKVEEIIVNGKDFSLSSSKVRYSFFRGIRLTAVSLSMNGLDISAPLIELDGNFKGEQEGAPLLPDVYAENLTLRIDKSLLSKKENSTFFKIPQWISRRIELSDCAVNYNGTEIECDLLLSQNSISDNIDFSSQLNTGIGTISLKSSIEPQAMSPEFEIESSLIYRNQTYDLSSSLTICEDNFSASPVIIRKKERDIVSFSCMYKMNDRSLFISFPDQEIDSDDFNDLLPAGRKMSGLFQTGDLNFTVKDKGTIIIPVGTAETEDFSFSVDGKDYFSKGCSLSFKSSPDDSIYALLSCSSLQIDKEEIKDLDFPFSFNLSDHSVKFNNTGFVYRSVPFTGEGSFRPERFRTDARFFCRGKDLTPFLPGMGAFHSVTVLWIAEKSDSFAADIRVKAEGRNSIDLSLSLMEREKEFGFENISFKNESKEVLSGTGSIDRPTGNMDFELKMEETDLGFIERLTSGDASFPAFLSGDAQVKTAATEGGVDIFINSDSMDILSSDIDLSIKNASVDAEFQGGKSASIKLNNFNTEYKGFPFSSCNSTVRLNESGAYIDSFQGVLYGGNIEGTVGMEADNNFLPRFSFEGRGISLPEMDRNYFRSREFKYGFQNGSVDFDLEGDLNDKKEVNCNGTLKSADVLLYPVEDYYSTLASERGSTDFSIKKVNVLIESEFLLEQNVTLKAEGIVRLSDDFSFESSELEIETDVEEGNNYRDCFFYFIPEVFQESEFSGSLSAGGKLILSEKEENSFKGHIEFADTDIRTTSTFNLHGMSGKFPLFISFDEPQKFAPSSPGWERDRHEEVFADFRKDGINSSEACCSLDIRSISYGAFKAADFNIPLRIENNMTVSPCFTGKFYGGELAGKIQLSINPEQTGFYVFSYLDDISVSGLCESHEGIRGMISGTLDGVAAFHNEFKENSTSKGILNVWAKKDGKEKRRISKDLLVNLGGEQALMFSRIKHIPYDEGELSCVLQDRYLIFNELKLYHTADPIGLLLRNDLSFEFRLPSSKNKIEVERLLNYMERTGAL